MLKFDQVKWFSYYLETAHGSEIRLGQCMRVKEMVSINYKSIFFARKKRKCNFSQEVAAELRKINICSERTGLIFSPLYRR
jgi:hypothetical protein